jgi:uncharacterized membrane protein YhaH (DUF805 family)
MEGTTPAGDFLTSLIPLIILSVPLAVVFAFILRRKGRSPWLCLLLLVPLVGQIYALYVVSLTDKEVLDRLARLETFK